LQEFEKVLATVSSGCEYTYSAMGRAGFLYESMKDRLEWTGLSARYYLRLISAIGQILCMSEEDYKKGKAKATRMSNEALASALISAFGDGK